MGDFQQRSPFLHSTHCSFNTVAMAGVRLQYRRRNPYNTSSNNVRVIKTLGGKLRLLHIKKRGTAPKCGDCGIKLPGVPALRPREYATTSRPKRPSSVPTVAPDAPTASGTESFV